jgi:tRNA (cmo5U34)-methyltransferase
MLRKAEEKCAGIMNVEFIHKEIIDIDFEKADLIVSAFTLQFIEIGRRKQVLMNIKKALRGSGKFIFCEKVRCEGYPEHDLYQKLYEEWKLNYYSPREIRLKRESLKGVLNSLSISENIKLLKTAGFTRAESFFQWCNFICFLAD